MPWLYQYRSAIRTIWLLVAALLALVVVVTTVAYLTGWRGLIILLGVAVLLGVLQGWLRKWVGPRTVLEVDFARGVIERLPEDAWSRLALRDTLVLRDIVDAVVRATSDQRVVGLIARISPIRMGLAHAQEIRDAILDFRRAGKKAVAWSDTFGEGHAGTVEYYLASAFDEIYLQPGGDLGLNGLLIQQPFLRGLFDRLGILPRIDHREEYKAFKYLFTEHGLTEPHRKSLAGVLESQMDQITDGIARSRGMGKAAVRELMDRSPLTAREALQAGLVTGLAYRDEAYERVKKETNGKLLYLSQYLTKAGRPHRKGQPIALIYGVGGIARGKSGSRRFPPGAVMGSDDVAAAFRAAIESKSVKAIVFRIDSPGGSVVASDMVWREVKRAREAGKPVVVSMSNVAGSGGYYVAAPASRIVAQPGTITGSIGVVSGKLVTEEAWRKTGVNWQGVGVGANAAMWSSTQDFTETQWTRLQQFLDEVYQDFKAKVAAGRNLSPEQVEDAAKGRIWTGAEAKARGLVDELGGLIRAIELAKQEAKIPAEKSIRVVPFPRRRWLESLLGRPESSEAAVGEAIVELELLLEPTFPLLSALGPTHERVLSMGSW